MHDDFAARYTRDRRFAVEVDPQSLGLPPGKVTVHALKALSDGGLMTVPSRAVGPRVHFEVGHEGAGRYVVTPVE